MTSPESIENQLQRLCGVIVSIQTHNSMVMIRSPLFPKTTVLVDETIIERGLRLGDAWEYSGTNEVHPSFGNIFRATRGCIIFPDDALTPDFISLNLSCISRKVSQQLWAQHGKNLIHILNTSDWQALIATGERPISLRVAFQLIEGWNRLKMEINAIAYFHSISLTTTEAVEFNRLYGDRTQAVVIKNPYSLTSVACFERVDRIAIKHFGFKLEDHKRTNAAICEFFSIRYQKNIYLICCSDLMYQLQSRYGFSDVTSTKAVRLALESHLINFKDGHYYGEGCFHMSQLIRRLVKSNSKLVEDSLISSSISVANVSDRETAFFIMNLTRHVKTHWKNETQLYLISSGAHSRVPHNSDLKQISMTEFFHRELIDPESSNLFVITNVDSLGLAAISKLLLHFREEDSMIFLANPFSPNESSFLRFISEFHIPIPIAPVADIIGREPFAIHTFESSLDEAKQLGHVLISELRDHEAVAVNLWFFISTRWSGDCSIVSLSETTQQEALRIAKCQLNEARNYNHLPRHDYLSQAGKLAVKFSEMDPKFFSVVRNEDLGDHSSKIEIIDRTILILKAGEAPSDKQIKNIMRCTKKQLLIVGDLKALSHIFRLSSNS